MQKGSTVRFHGVRARAVSSIGFALGLFCLTGCAVEAGDEGPLSETEATEALHSGGGSLPWRGFVPTFPGSTSGRTGVLSVIYEVDIGMTRVCTGGVLGVGQECHHELRGMQVSSYAPTNPNNSYTNGDQLWSTIIGRSTAGSWTRRTCPAGTVLSGYNIWARSERIEKLQVKCRNLTTGVSQDFGTPVGSTSLLFSDFLTCGDYVGSIQMNQEGNGMGATCVRK